MIILICFLLTYNSRYYTGCSFICLTHIKTKIKNLKKSGERRGGDWVGNAVGKLSFHKQELGIPHIIGI
jgi:hypothetical protein